VKRTLSERVELRMVSPPNTRNSDFATSTYPHQQIHQRLSNLVRNRSRGYAKLSARQARPLGNEQVSAPTQTRPLRRAQSEGVRSGSAVFVSETSLAAALCVSLVQLLPQEMRLYGALN
jgi:hypothetical protein